MAVDTIDKIISGMSDAISQQQNPEGSSKPTILCPNCGKIVDIENANKNVTPGTQMFITIQCPECHVEFLPPAGVSPANVRKEQEPEAGLGTRPTISRFIRAPRRGDDEDE